MSNDINLFHGDTLEITMPKENSSLVCPDGTKVNLPPGSTWYVQDTMTKAVVPEERITGYDIPLQTEYKRVGAYICMYCGNRYLNIVEQCPTCGARSIYEDHTES